jgi:putative FmdB family regulatory protein
MPIYEYQCQSCGCDVEKLQRINDKPLVDCPECGKPELRRLVSAAGFRLKGAGWYETDFKKAGKKNLHDGGDSGAKTVDKPAEKTGAESKPAAAKSTAD